jgi:hypothetical protein
MPYRSVGRWVQVKRGRRWMNLKRHPDAAAARKHASALNVNVEHK